MPLASSVLCFVREHIHQSRHNSPLLHSTCIALLPPQYLLLFYSLLLCLHLLPTMVAFATLLLCTILAVLSNVSQALPYTLERRIVGTLTCQKVASGNLNLYDSKTKATYGVTFANNYRLNDSLNGASRPSSLEGYGNPRILSSYPKATAEEFEFWACMESARPGFEDFSPSANGTYHGHISSTRKPSYCLNHLSVYADEAYLVSE